MSLAHVTLVRRMIIAVVSRVRAVVIDTEAHQSPLSEAVSTGCGLSWSTFKEDCIRRHDDWMHTLHKTTGVCKCPIAHSQSCANDSRLQHTGGADVLGATVHPGSFSKVRMLLSGSVACCIGLSSSRSGWCL